MTISILAILAIAFLIMLGVLGHGQWHHGEVAFMGFILNVFTGAHATGLDPGGGFEPPTSGL